MVKNPVEEFLRNQTSLLMQKHLMITKIDAGKILQSFDRRQMKIFADNIPALEEYINYLAAGGVTEDYNLAKDPLNREDLNRIKSSFNSKLPEHALSPPKFASDFIDLFANNPSMLLVEKLSLLLTIKEILLKRYKKSEAEVNAMLAEIKPAHISEFYRYLSFAPSDIVISFEIYQANENYFIFNEIDRSYPHVPTSIKSQLISAYIIREYFVADSDLKEILFVDKLARRDILSNWSPALIHLISPLVLSLKAKVLNEIQGPFGQNRLELINIIFSIGHNYGDHNSPIMDEIRQSGDIRLLPKMISTTFVSVINQLPQVLGRDDRGNMLELEIYQANQVKINLIYETLAMGRSYLSVQLQSLPDYPPSSLEQSFSPALNLMPMLSLFAAGTALGVYAVRHFYTMWSASVTNNALVKFLESLPPAEENPDFLTVQQLEKFEKFTDEMTDVELKAHNKKNIERYKEYLTQQCVISLDKAEEIDDPLRIEGIYLAPPSESENNERKIIRRWDFLYDFKSFVEYAKSLSALAPALIPQTKDPVLLSPQDGAHMFFNRSTPAFIKEFVQTARRSIALSKPLDKGFFMQKDVAIDVKPEPKSPTKKGKK